MARRWIAAGMISAAAASPAGAAEIALVIGNDPAADAQVGLLADTLNARGYEVYERRSADREALASVLGEIEDRLAEADRLILFFAGATLSADGAAWLLPQDAEAVTRLDLAFEGLRLDALLALAAGRPGRSAVVVGSAEDGEERQGVRAGIGAPEVPQGVLLVAGPTEAAIEALTDHLLVEATAVAAAVQGLEDADVTVAGFAAPDASLAPTLGDRPALVDEAIETTTAPAATSTAPAAPAPDPAEAAESALNLSQAERRQVQEDLTVLGQSTRGIDGIFGRGTRTAIAAWQRARGFEPTGYIDAEQHAALREQAAARSAEMATEAEAARRVEEEADAAFWRTTGAQGGTVDLRAYLDRYPDGIYAGEARAALQRVEAETRAAAQGEDRAAWERAEAAGTAQAFRRYLEARPEGAFAEQAAARIAALEAEPERQRRNAAAREREDGLGLNSGSRALIESQLAAVGYDPGAADGEFDRQTRRAIREFQTRQGLDVTGFIDQATVQALIVASLGLR